MSILQNCLLLDGIQPTTAFALELWENYAKAFRNGSYPSPGMSTLFEHNDMTVDLDAYTDEHGPQFSVTLIRGLEDNLFEDLRSRFFPATERGLVDMVAEIRIQRRLAEQGMCACGVRLKVLGVDVCSLCFFKRTSCRALA